MANTFALLSYANTFDNWMVLTNNLTKENNDFALNNYTKPTGTLYLNDPNTGLQVTQGAIFQGALQVTGIGSSAYVQNNLSVDRQVYFTNTTLGLVNYGQANINGTLIAQGPNTGLYVANNANIGGSLYVIGNGTFNNDVYVLNNSDITVSGNSYVANISYTNTLQANSKAIVGILNVFGPSYTDTLQANVRINAPLINSTGQTLTNSLQANTYVNVIGNTYTDILQANTRINTASLLVTNGISTSSIFASNNIYSSGDMQANGNMTVIGRLTACSDFVVSGNFVLSGNTAFNLSEFTLNSNLPNADAKISVNRAPGTNASIQWSETRKQWELRDINNPNNNFTSYSKILSANSISDSVSLPSSVNVASSLAANTLSNSIISIQNTDLTQNLAITFASNQANIAQALSQGAYNLANVTVGVDATQNASILIIQGVDATQNVVIQTTFNQANATQALAQGAYNLANVTIGVDATQNVVIQTTFNQANATQALAQGAYNLANVTIGVDATQNNLITIIQGVDATQNIAIQAAFDKANTGSGGSGIDQYARDTANSAARYANTDNTVIVATTSSANGLFIPVIQVSANGRVLSVTNTAILGTQTSGTTSSNTYLVTYSSANVGAISANSITLSSIGVVDSFSASTYRSAKYLAQMTVGSNYHMTELSLIHDGISVWISQYGEVFNNVSLGTYDASITSGILNLSFNPVSPGTTIKILRTNIVV
jgi:hypothetical protein